MLTYKNNSRQYTNSLRTNSILSSFGELTRCFVGVVEHMSRLDARQCVPEVQKQRSRLIEVGTCRKRAWKYNCTVQKLTKVYVLNLAWVFTLI